MTPFMLLSPLIRSLFSVWAVLLCVGFIGSSVYSFSHLRARYAVGSFMLLLPPYFIFQLCTVISDWYLHGKLPDMLKNIVMLPYLLYIIVLSPLTVLCVMRLYLGYHYNDTHITPKSVKQAADNLPTGFVYYFESGQIYLSNHQMNRLDIELFNHPLLNGAKFAQRLADKNIFETKDGTVWRFTKNELDFKGNPIYEIIAENITELYRKNEKLRADNKALRKYNRRMRKYGEQIAETVKREEILKAKLNIHDEMNQILLIIGNALSQNTSEKREKVLNELQQNVLLLCMNAELQTENPLTDISKIAESIGIAVHLNQEPALQSKAMLTFILAAQECMINAVKHAEAKNFYITVTETDERLICVFTNDGKLPGAPVKEGGGLANLRQRIEKQGGSMQVEIKPEFTLTAVIPKEESRDEI